jgi:acid phosphatase type 7
VREFVVGTGGKSHLPLTTVQVGSQVRNADTFGVLELTLRPGGYGWRFRPVAGGSFTDAGAAACH